MSAEVIPFDFEEQAVRVLMRDGEPWFVAADVCRVLTIANRHDAVGRLDEDERDAVGNTDSIGRTQKMTIISESGLYALIVTSNKPEAKRFRKWVTAEVLPSIRRTGRYELAEPAEEAEAVAGAGTDDLLGPRDWLALIREARILGGLSAGRRLWALSPLPPLAGGLPAQAAGPGAAEGRACLAHLLGYETGVGTVRWLLSGAAASPELSPNMVLGRVGLRFLPEGRLFVANGPWPAFAGSRWAGGGHRAALLAIPGAEIAGEVRSLAGVRARGVIVPVPAFGLADTDNTENGSETDGE